MFFPPPPPFLRMSHQPFQLHQYVYPLWIDVQVVDDEIANLAEANQYQCLPHSEESTSPSYGVADLGVAHQCHSQFTSSSSINPANPTPDYSLFLQEYHRFSVVPFPTPPSSLAIPIPTSSHGISTVTTDPSPVSSASPSTSASASSLGSVTTNPDVCRQSQPLFDEQTRRWSCSGCNKKFSDKYGTERHIATVGLKVTCRYCGSRVSALDFSRRRHFRRESCLRQGFERGFSTRNEDDAFIDDP